MKAKSHYTPLKIVFSTHDALEAEACKLKFPPDILPERVSVVEFPTSTVETSLNCSVLPIQNAVNVPALPLEALTQLYSTWALL